ncbi:MAG: CPBP family intramembrane metalloprotease [Flavobacteriales bacterium]|nr:CPBP family intramembrane metalloprotease [Flavobacteriales bacterium]
MTTPANPVLLDVRTAAPVSVLRILLFYTIAVVVSNVFRFDLLHLNAVWAAWSGLGYLVARNVLEGSGVLLGALVGLYALRRVRPLTISFWGTSQRRVLAMAAVPLVLLTLIGVRNAYGVNEHLFGAVATAAVLMYCTMEEYAWRGYLQQELGGLQHMLRYGLIGVLWYGWHLSFLENPGLWPNVFFLGTLVLGSWGIGQVAVITRSIAACACFHFIINIALFNVFFHKALDPPMLAGVMVACIGAWILILRKWEGRAEAARS